MGVKKTILVSLLAGYAIIFFANVEENEHMTLC